MKVNENQSVLLDAGTVSRAGTSARVRPVATMSRGLLWGLTLTTALAVGNVYYSQPLLGEIAQDFKESAVRIGMVPMLTQLGYVIGLFFLTPLGDVLEKRRLISSMLLLSGFALLGAGLAPSYLGFAAAALFIGLTSVVTQILIPFVAALSDPQERSGNLGTVLSGALIGVLISRTLSGWIGGHFGWRTVYGFGAATMTGLGILLWRVLPEHVSSTRIRYPDLLASLWKIFRETPQLRRVAFNGALMYAALSAFWATLAFFLHSDAYHLGPEAAGWFGLVGAGSAALVPLVGRHVDRLGARRVVGSCIVMMLAAYAVFALVGTRLPGLVLGVILLDIGAQAATVSNQTQIYRFRAEAQSRINTIYKILYFGGGALGSGVSAVAWQAGGWLGVCVAGAVFLVAARVVLPRPYKPSAA